MSPILEGLELLDKIVCSLKSNMVGMYMLLSKLAYCPAARCLDSYVEQRARAAERETSGAVDPRLEAIIQLLFER